LAWTGLALGAFLILHLLSNFLALWPKRFQAMAARNHSLGAGLAAVEIALIFAPLAVHAAFGLRTLKRERLRFGVKKHHGGSDVRNWLQRASATVLLAFLLFHVATVHRWFGGCFNPNDAFASVSKAVWGFGSGQPGSSPMDLLIAQFYLVGIVAAVFHLANGVATGAEVLGWAETPARQRVVNRACLIAAPVLLLAGLAAWQAVSAGF
jgi:succinate dehydrogenase / fumarate reductase cytochrome b subunit